MATDFGSDISTFAGVGNTVDIDPLLPLMTGQRCVLEAVARRFMTVRGSLAQGAGKDVASYGFDLMGIVGKRMTQVAILRAQADIEAEAEKEQRVLKATLVEFVEVTPNAYRMRLSISTAGGPFDLTLSVSAVSVAILQA